MQNHNDTQAAARSYSTSFAAGTTQGAACRSWSTAAGATR
jgi:hypothetical protein